MAAESIVSERSYTKLCVVAFEEVRIQMVKRRTFAFERRQGIVKLRNPDPSGWNIGRKRK